MKPEPPKFESIKLPIRATGLALFSFAFLIYLLGHFALSFDLTTYLAYARNYLNGNGLIDVDGFEVNSRQLYILMLIGVLSFSNSSLLAVMIFEVFWSALLALSVWTITRRLFSDLVSILISLLFILTPTLMFWLPRHIDPVWPTFVLFSLVALLDAVDLPPGSQKRLLLLTISGAICAAGFFVKATALLMIPVPFVMWLLVRNLFRTTDMAGFVIGFLGMFVFLFGMFSILFALPSETSDAVQHSSALSSRLGGLSADNLVEVGFQIVWGLVDFHISTLGFSVPIWPFGVAGFAILVHQRFVSRKSGKSLFILALAACFAPFAAYCSILGLRPSQNLPYIASLYLGAGVVFETLRKRVASIAASPVKSHPPTRRLATALPAIFTVFLATALLYCQFTLDEVERKRAFSRNLVGRLIAKEYDMKIELVGEELADWLSSNQETVAINGGGIFIDDEFVRHSITYLHGQTFSVKAIPWKEIGGTISSTYAQKENYASGERPAIIASNGWREGSHSLYMYQLEWQKLRTALEQTGIKLFATYDRQKGQLLTEWLSSMARMELLAVLPRGNSTMSVYRITELAEQPRNTLSVDTDIVRFMQFLETVDPQRLVYLNENSLAKEAGISPVELGTLMNIFPGETRTLHELD